MMDFRPPLTLEGRYLRLVPLVQGHVDGLVRAGKDPEIWRWMQYGYSGTPEGMQRLVELLLTRQSAGTDLAFTILLKPDDTPIGMTRYLGIDRANRNVEVGGTWLDSSLWRTPLNSDSKLRMLSNAFDTEGCARVQIKTDVRNIRSQRAIERLGAQREGLLRQHMVRFDGTFRDSVVYSILRAEWPETRQRLKKAVEGDWTPPARG